MEKTTKAYQPIIVLHILALLLIVIESSSVMAEDFSLETVIEGTPVLQGIIRKVSVEKQTITIKAGKERKINILILPSTKFIGASTLTELKRGRGVKVWHSQDGEKYRALKVELLLELGC